MLRSSTSIAVRKGRASDAKALAALFRQSWLLAYRGIIPHLHLDSLVRQRTPEWWKRAIRNGTELLVIAVDGEVAGYATLGGSRGKGQAQGEIYELYLAPAYQGMGLGEHLFEAARHRLDERRMRGLIIWALSDNTQAIDFYWRRGGRPVTQAFERFGTARLEKIAFTWD